MIHGPFFKICAWCGAEFTTGHPGVKCCGSQCQANRSKQLKQRSWRRYYRANKDRLLAYYASYHAANKEARNLRQREWQRRRTAEMTDAQLARRRARNRQTDKRHSFVRKVCDQWRVTVAEARAMIESGSFPP